MKKMVDIIKELFKKTWFWALLLIVINLLVYYQSLNHFFFSDDFVWLHHGEMIRADITWLWRLKVTSFFSPVVNAYFFLGQSLFPDNFVAYHVLGVVIHALNSFFIFLLVKRLSTNRWAAGLSAFIFSISFYHYEAVFWISSIMHVLVTFFVLLGLLTYVKYFDNRKKIWLVLSIIFGCLSFFTKENGIVFVPMVFGFYLYLQRNCFWKFKKWIHLIPHLLTLLYFLYYTYSRQKDSMWIANGVYNFSIKAVNQLVSSFFGLFHFNYGKFVATRIDWMLITCLICCAFLFWLYKKHKELVGDFLLSVFIAILGFMPVMFFYFGSWKAISQSRYSYLPTIGLSLCCMFLYKLCLKIYEKISYKKFFLSGIVLLIFVFSWYNVASINKIFVKDYIIIEKQMLGMKEGFLKLKDEIQASDKVIMAGGYPFLGNEYYRHMYRYIIDETRSKPIEDWQSIADTELVEKEYLTDEYVVLKWVNEGLTIKKYQE